jgi:hypothetical protein
MKNTEIVVLLSIRTSSFATRDKALRCTQTTVRELIYVRPPRKRSRQWK